MTNHEPVVRRLLTTGCILMGFAVALGAFGAHGLKAHTDAYGLATWETAVRYQAWHALGLIAIAATSRFFSTKTLNAAFICMLIGTLIFSGTLYILVLSGLKWLGAITPIGGVLMIVAWLVLAVSSKQRPRSS